MNPSDLKKLLQQLNKTDLLLILAFVTTRWLRHKITTLHPAHLAIPITALQVGFFILAVGTSTRLLPTLAIGFLLIVAIAFIPTLVPRKPAPIRAHWVRRHD